MCIGGSQPKAPEVRYVGPSDADIRRNEQGLQAFQAQIQQQQQTAAAEMQRQIATANERTAEIQSQFDEEVAAAESAAAEAADAAAAAAGASYTPVGAYGVTASETEAPAAQTTQPIKAKKKPKTTLKISPMARLQCSSAEASSPSAYSTAHRFDSAGTRRSVPRSALTARRRCFAADFRLP